MVITIPQNWEKRPNLLLFSVCASQNTGLEYTLKEHVLEVISMGPDAQDVTTISDPGPIHVPKVLPPGFF